MNNKMKFKLIAGVLAGLGAFIFLFLSSLSFDMIAYNGSSFSKTTESYDMSGFDAIFGYSLMGAITVSKFNILLLLAMAIGITICVILIIDGCEKIKKDLTIIYLTGLIVTSILVLLSGSLISLSDIMELALKSDGAESVTLGFSITIYGVISGICFVLSAISLLISKWIIKERF